MDEVRSYILSNNPLTGTEWPQVLMCNLNITECSQKCDAVDDSCVSQCKRNSSGAKSGYTLMKDEVDRLGALNKKLMA